MREQRRKDIGVPLGEEKIMNERERLGNPAVVGLAGFGMTTLILQFYNLGWSGLAPVIWIGLCFGGAAQLIAGLLEFRNGNNFGFAAFTGYGAFWISLCLMLIFGTSTEVTRNFGALKFSDADLGYYLLMWTIFTAILFVISMKHNTVLALLFLTLLLGYFFLDIKELGHSNAAGVIAAYDLIVCAILALYLMMATVAGESGMNMPIGKPWIRKTS